MADKQEKSKKPTKDSATGKASRKSAVKAKGKAKPAKVEAQAVPADYKPRLLKTYQDSIVPELKKQFGYANPMLIPKLDKIVLNVGIGTLHQDTKLAESIASEFRIVTGQQPVLTRARLSISNFKLRQGMLVGCKVTLRRFRMYEFLDRLISIVIPRIRDFRGLSDKSFDGRGNFTFGVKEQIIFPEIDYDDVVKIHGMDISLCTSARTDEEAMMLLRGFGFPFRHKPASQDAA